MERGGPVFRDRLAVSINDEWRILEKFPTGLKPERERKPQADGYIRCDWPEKEIKSHPVDDMRVGVPVGNLLGRIIESCAAD
jgi:hypothetical protein